MAQTSGLDGVRRHPRGLCIGAIDGPALTANEGSNRLAPRESALWVRNDRTDTLDSADLGRFAQGAIVEIDFGMSQSKSSNDTERLVSDLFAAVHA